MKTLKVCWVLLLVVFFTGCKTSSRLIQQGQYDAAIERSVERLKRNPDNKKEILNLERAYRIVNEQNYERVRFLNAEANPRSFVEIVDLYSRMKFRQTLVRTVTPLNLPDRVVQFPYVDFDQRIIEAQRGAAEFHYERALELMERNERIAYREAWYSLALVEEMAGDYRNLRRLLPEAYEKGVSRALVVIQNHTHLNLPEEYKQQLLTVDPRGLENQWVEFYYSDLDERISFDYFIQINLRQILISPDQTQQSDQQFRKEVEDGFEYALDARGNVKKDSLGNDIKIPKYKTLVCVLVETRQLKTITIEGDVEIFSADPRRLLKREPVGSASRFEHRSARAVGDIEALDNESRKLIQTRPLPFPSDVEMILRTSEGFRVAVATALRRNRNLIW
jgi:tetratricopeptide (TPR) repeat protein